MAFPFSLHIESRRCLRVTVWGRDDESEIQRKKNDFLLDTFFRSKCLQHVTFHSHGKNKSKNIFKEELNARKTGFLKTD